jgi:hypothetical protein
VFVGVEKLMKVYKYKSLGDTDCLGREKQLGYLKDIYENHRFYASSYNVLDDPMEGIFESYLGVGSYIVQKIINGKDDIRICSLSPTFRSMLMWSFYANCHKGYCVEAEIDDRKLIKVLYDDNPIIIESQNGSEEDKIRMLLSRKYKDWAFEKELRVLCKESYVDITVSKIYFGMRVEDTLFQQLKAEIQSKNKNIGVDKMKENMFEHINTSDEK